MLSKTCTRILRPYGFEDVHTPLPAQYALNRLIRLDRHSGIHTRESRAGPHGGSLELPIERPTLLRFDFRRGDAPDFVEVGEAGIAMDDAMRRQRRVQLVGLRTWIDELQAQL